tara:strand:+ start:2264 stop:2494 length:231 start_codon:yes stop_codon:yes gene_type:complete
MRYIDRKEFTSELAKISLSNEDITRYGDGFEKAIELVYGVINKLPIYVVSKSLPSDIEIGEAMSKLSEIADKEAER